MEDRKINRRKLLRFLVDGTLYSVTIRLMQKNLSNKPKGKIEQPHDKKLEVKTFRDRTIEAVVERDHNGIEVYTFLPYSIGYSTAFFGLIEPDLKRNPEKRIMLGIVNALLNLIDSGYTALCVTPLKDSRFREYGFDERFYEHNPLVNRHPTRDQIASSSTLTAPLAFGLTYFFPRFIGLYVPNILPICAGNRETSMILRKSYELGDRVNEMIRDGKNEAAIDEFLRDYVQRRN